MTQPANFDLLKLNISRRITDEATLFQLGGLLGVNDWEITGIRYNKDKDGNNTFLRCTVAHVHTHVVCRFRIQSIITKVLN